MNCFADSLKNGLINFIELHLTECLGMCLNKFILKMVSSGYFESAYQFAKGQELLLLWSMASKYQ